MVIMKKFQYILLVAIAAVFLTSCEKVSPIGILVSGTGVEDRVKMSYKYFREYKSEFSGFHAQGDEYTFLVGSDSHITTDCGRMEEMLKRGIDDGDMFMAHLGDIADTKIDYYINLENALNKAKKWYVDKYFEKDYIYDEETNDSIPYYYDPDANNSANVGIFTNIEDVHLPFYPVVGNHDITHNGWAMWSNIFHSSFYDFYVGVGYVDDILIFDHFIFLDTASGTLGREQVNLIEQGVMDDRNMEEMGIKTRNTFVFSHTNIFRPRSVELASTFAREELYFLLNKFREWNVTIAFLGHVHKWDDRVFGDVQYLTLDSMCEANNPEPGDYLVRVHVKRNGTVTWEKVHMNYTPNNKK